MNKIRRSLVVILLVVILLVVITWIIFTYCVYQRADMRTDMSVSSPKFNPETSPRVSFDSGHGNFHDIKTTYAPFAMLLKNDGIVLRRHEGLFTENTLQDIELLIIVNATPIGGTEGETSGAFTESEINVLRNWV